MFMLLYRCTFFFFFFNDTATTEIYTLSLHDALPISLAFGLRRCRWREFQALTFSFDTLRYQYLRVIDRIGGERNEIDDQLIRNSFKVVDQTDEFLWSLIQHKDQAKMPTFQILGNGCGKCLGIE